MLILSVVSAHEAVPALHQANRTELKFSVVVIKTMFLIGCWGFFSPFQVPKNSFFQWPSVLAIIAVYIGEATGGGGGRSSQECVVHRIFRPW